MSYLCPSQRIWLRQLAALDAEVLDINEATYEVKYEHNQVKLNTTEDRLLPREKINAPNWVANAWGDYETISIRSRCLTIPFEALLDELEHIISEVKANLKRDRVVKLRIYIEQPVANITLELNRRVVFRWYQKAIKRSELLTKLNNL
ncbi:hypothetical protein AN214_04028 [Pseudoalteromonas sp. P1-9]|uniref:hypothetical protein n=1 Tax=Pseudoalteromonas sp. P1-9 TaxID=1710354 RepID=UPI0006D62794|nr:hypothetical protein [Pseudoalteromonas sp. P1-9]KPV93929.1 hypothetical protein AN214_04028 [Pseudoalteromonas sp. P1-9]